VKNYLCKISQRKIDVYRLHISSEIYGSFHPNSTSASMGNTSDFAQNCTKCAPVGAIKNPQASDENSKRFRFYGLLNCKGHNPFLPSWITVFILKGFWKPITSFLCKT